MLSINKKILVTIVSTVILSGSNFSANAMENVQIEPTQMWQKYDDNPGFQDALDELGIDYNNLINPAYASTYDAKNVNNPLFWLYRTLAIYSDAEQEHYNIPVTEVHADGRARTTSHGRNSYFLTHAWGKKDERITLRLGDVPANVSCYAAIDPNYENIAAPIDSRLLSANSETTYTFSQNGLLVLGCTDKTKKMENVDQLISVDIVSGGTYHPLFIFGLNSKAEWSSQAQATTPSGYHFMFDGRVRYVANHEIAKKTANNNILQTLRQSLLRTITFDKLDGLDGSDWLNQPSRGLLFATYQSCCWANGGQGLTGIGFNKTIPETPTWGDWHEYGHHFQMGWSWNGLTEITVNLYSLAACYTTLGETDVKNCHTNSGLSGFTWDQQAVGTLLNSGQSWDFNNENQFRRATFFAELMTSWPELYPTLGKAYRKVNQDNPALVNTSQKKIDWFTLNASKIAGVNLHHYFQQWNIPLSAEASMALDALKLPQPQKMTRTFTTSMTETTPGKLKIGYEGDRKNIAFITNSSKAGPTSLVWAGSSDTAVYAQVVDNRNRVFVVKLRGKTSHGGCANYAINAATSCSSGNNTFLNVAYKAEDNPLLPKGSYTGVLHLIARDWHHPDWTANVNVDLSIQK
ncbi:M60 family metallopeptidase [Enterobacter sichuanensis]|uniref:M60 family metallopeptidase n=1 Tax=Enterobacter sichuanensis TaxID=2071710 RepID=UPI002FD01AFE